MAFERRKYTRYLTQSDTFAALGSHFTKVGKMKDISLGGLAFEYINNSEDQDQQPFKVSVFLTSNKFFIWNVPCRLVYDSLKTGFSDNQNSGLFYVLGRCGLEFTDIREDQKQNLEYYFNHHTRGTVPPANYLNINH